jgi:tetratricopeptide (TPR) repeat protein
MKTIDKYLFHALDNYPYSLEETVEALDYTLSYDNENTTALCLYARLQSEQLQDYEKAKSYYQEAIAINLHAVGVYPYYIETLILNEDFDEAAKLIDFALTIKGINKVQVLLHKITLLEKQQQFKCALKTIEEIKLLDMSDEVNHFEKMEKRLKFKKELIEKKKKSKKEAAKLEKKK